jgi:Glycosyltransferase family 87
LLNVVAWWMIAQFSHAMTGSGRKPGVWLEALPGIVTVTFVFDMFDLGQPNLMLLAMMLYGFWLLRWMRPWMAGSMFALATAIKVFPVAVLPYLIWRKQWAAAASMVVFLGLFLFVLPAPFRGYQHNVRELKTWYQGMIGSSSEKGFGQRDEQNWSWVNQSIIAMTHRLTRPVNYGQDDPTQIKPARYMNVANLDFNTANLIVVAVSLLIGLGYLAVMPKASRRTERSDAEEIGILFCLMTVASPLARQYYFMWLFFPMTVLMHRAAYDPRPAVRTGTWALLAVAGCLMLLSLPVFPIDLQAFGNNLAATVVLVAGLVWHMLHPLVADASTALPPAATGLQIGADHNAHSQGIS